MPVHLCVFFSFPLWTGSPIINHHPQREKRESYPRDILRGKRLPNIVSAINKFSKSPTALKENLAPKLPCAPLPADWSRSSHWTWKEPWRSLFLIVSTSPRYHLPVTVNLLMASTTQCSLGLCLYPRSVQAALKTLGKGYIFSKPIMTPSPKKSPLLKFHLSGLIFL